MQPWRPAAALDAAYRRAQRLTAQPGLANRFGTWDWPAVNAGAHHPNTFLVLHGPGVRAGYRRPRGAMLSAVAPTLCELIGLPVPRDADGPLPWDAVTRPLAQLPLYGNPRATSLFSCGVPQHRPQRRVLTTGFRITV